MRKTLFVLILLAILSFRADAEPEDADLRMLTHLGIKLPDDGEFGSFFENMALKKTSECFLAVHLRYLSSPG